MTFLLLFVTCDFFAFVLRMKASQLVTYGSKFCNYNERGQQRAFSIYKKFRKISVGNFRLGRARSICPKCHSFTGPSSVASLNLPRIFKMEADEAHQMLFLCEMLEFSVEEESLINSEDDAVQIFSVASTFMRRNLQRTEGYFEHAVPEYSLDEFKSHFRMTRSSMEGLCRVIQATGRDQAYLITLVTAFSMCEGLCEELRF